jgi:hypothetical protein
MLIFVEVTTAVYKTKDEKSSTKEKHVDRDSRRGWLIVLGE